MKEARRKRFSLTLALGEGRCLRVWVANLVHSQKIKKQTKKHKKCCSQQEKTFCSSSTSWLIFSECKIFADISAPCAVPLPQVTSWSSHECPLSRKVPKLRLWPCPSPNCPRGRNMPTEVETFARSLGKFPCTLKKKKLLQGPNGGRRTSLGNKITNENDSQTAFWHLTLEAQRTSDPAEQAAHVLRMQPLQQRRQMNLAQNFGGKTQRKQRCLFSN